MSEKPTPNEEDIQEEELEEDDIFDEVDEETQDESTLEEGSDSEKADQEEALSDEAFLKRVNEVEGRDYKSIEDYKKTVAERNKRFSEEGRKNKEVKEKPTPTDYTELEVLFFDSKPEAELVKSDLEKIAKAKGISVIRAWKEEDWIQEKAKNLQEKEEAKNKNKKKVMSPANDVVPEEKDAEQKAIEKRLSADLPPGFSA